MMSEFDQVAAILIGGVLLAAIFIFIAGRVASMKNKDHKNTITIPVALEATIETLKRIEHEVKLADSSRKHHKVS